MIVSSVWFGPDGRIAHRVGYSWVTPELLQGGLLCAAFGALPAWVTLWVTLWVTWWVTLGGSLSCMQFQIRGLPNQFERCSMAELSCCLPCLLFIVLLLLGHLLVVQALLAFLTISVRVAVFYYCCWAEGR